MARARTIAILAQACLLAGVPVHGLPSSNSSIPAPYKSCTQLLVTSKNINIITDEEMASIKSSAAELASRVIEASGDTTLKIDFRKTTAALGKEVEGIFGSYDTNKLMKTSLHDLKFNENTVASDKEKPDGLVTLSDVMNMLAKIDTSSRGLQRVRALRHLPLVGATVGNYIVEHSADRMQTAANAVGQMVKALDKRVGDLEEANVEIEKEIERNDKGLAELERSIAFSLELFDELQTARTQAASSIQQTNLDKFLKLLAERITSLQELSMAGQAMVAVLAQKVEHNEMGIKQIQRVKVVSIPITVGASIIQASTVRLERGIQTSDAIKAHNNQMMSRITQDMTSQGTRLRERENSSVTDQTAIRTALAAVQKEIVKQAEHDRLFTENVKGVIAQNQIVIEEATRIRRKIAAQASVEQLQISSQPFSAEVSAVKSLAAAAIETPGQP